MTFPKATTGKTGTGRAQTRWRPLGELTSRERRSGALPVRNRKSFLIGPVSPEFVQALPLATKVETQMLGKICMMMVLQRNFLTILLVVRPIESSWPKLKRGPVAKVMMAMKTPGTGTKAVTIPLAVIAREVEESLVHAGEATDGEAQPGTRPYPLRAVRPLLGEVHANTRPRELIQRFTSTSLGPFETLSTRTRTTARDHGGKDKRITAHTPLSATARQAARSSVRSPPSSKKLPSSANRQVSALSQPSRYVLFM